MGWLGGIVLFAVFWTQCVIPTEAKVTPWSNTGTAVNFMQNFGNSLAGTGMFNSGELGDINSIGQSMIGVMQSTSGSDAAVRNAMNMAFASGIAEIVAEQSNPATLAAQKSAIVNAMSQAGMPKSFIREILELIDLFVNEALEESNEVAYYPSQQGASTSVSTSVSSSSSSVASSVSTATSQAASSRIGSLTNYITSQPLNVNTFTNALSSTATSVQQSHPQLSQQEALIETLIEIVVSLLQAYAAEFQVMESTQATSNIIQTLSSFLG